MDYNKEHYTVIIKLGVFSVKHKEKHLIITNTFLMNILILTASQILLSFIILFINVLIYIKINNLAVDTCR